MVRRNTDGALQSGGTAPRHGYLRGLPAKIAPTISLAGALLGSTLSLATAGSLPGETRAGPAILSSNEILDGVRHFGLDPIGQPVRRGPYYVLHAYDGTGIELRVVADAQFGDILFIAPAMNAALTPPYVRAARIIQVPEAGARNGSNGTPANQKK